MTIYLQNNYTVSAGETLALQDEFGFVSSLAENPVKLINSGTIEVTGGAPKGVSGSAPDGSLFWNKAGGVFRVAATGEGGHAFGTWSGMDFRNSGLVEVSSAAGDATGAFSLSGNSAIVNEGTIRVNAADDAVGIHVHGGAPVANAGYILARGGTSAHGVELPDAFVMTFNNAGRIVAKGSSPDATSVGVANGSMLFMENSGLIKGDYAIQSDLSFDSDVVTNLGTLIGIIDLSGGNDELRNTGLIRGDVLLGEEGDLFDNRGGTVKGAVFGDLGQDTLIGGDGADVLHGGQRAATGQDEFNLLSGGAGADRLYGSDGGNRFVGGLGADLITAGVFNTFVYNRLGDSTARKADLIVGLQDGDVLDLSGVDADATRAGNQAFHLVAGLSHHAGELALVFDEESGETWLLADVDGNAKADMLVRIDGDHTDFTDFVL